MLPWILSLAGTLLSGCIAFLVERGRRLSADNARFQAEGKVALLERDLQDLTLRTRGHEEECERLRYLSTKQREELHGLQEELSKCDVPGAARERLQRVLSAHRVR